MKCEKPSKDERIDNWINIRSLKNTTICFSMVDLLCKVLISTQNLFYNFHNLDDNELNSLIKSS